ncbi:MAG: hypothetical protein DCC67_17920, partial [Planctomycetota bacterium]
MISYPFPPANSGGVFRILRFCKYLPEFGWEPIVLTPKPEAVHPITVDPTLDALIPANLEVHRTTVLRPIVRAKAGLERVKQRGQRSADVPVAGPPGERSLPTPASPPVSALGGSRLRNQIKTWEQRFFSNPDRHIGWLLPAVWAGLRLIRRRRPAVIYTTGPPHST